MTSYESVKVKGEYYTPEYHLIRMKVFARDGWHCQFPRCDKKKKLDLHHIIPRSWGGPTVSWNLVALCRTHHEIVDSLIGVSPKSGKMNTHKDSNEQRSIYAS